MVEIKKNEFEEFKTSGFQFGYSWVNVQEKYWLSFSDEAYFSFMEQQTDIKLPGKYSFQWGTLILGSEPQCFFAFLTITPVLDNVFAPNFREMLRASRQRSSENMKLKC